MGLRDEKKRATRAAIADTALGLFLADGFDRVTVAGVARAAQVSVNTVFNYFPTKEDLFFDRQDEITTRLSGAVRRRRPEETVAAAVHRAFVEKLEADSPTLGLHPGMAGFWRVVDESPALQARARLLHELTERSLADALIGDSATDPDRARMAAALLSTVDRALHSEIRNRVQRGEKPETVRVAVRATADRVYAGLDHLI